MQHVTHGQDPSQVPNALKSLLKQQVRLQKAADDLQRLGKEHEPGPKDLKQDLKLCSPCKQSYTLEACVEVSKNHPGLHEANDGIARLHCRCQSQC